MGANHCHPYDVFSSLYIATFREIKNFLHNSSVIKFSAAESSQQVFPVLNVHCTGAETNTLLRKEELKGLHCANLHLLFARICKRVCRRSGSSSQFI